MGKLDEAEGYFQQSLVIDREVQDRQGEGVVLSLLGQIAQRRGKLDEAEGYFQQSLVIRREVQDRQGEGAVLSSLGRIAQRRGKLDELAEIGSSPSSNKSLVIPQTARCRTRFRARASSSPCSANRPSGEGKLDEAEGYFQQSLVIDREVQDRQGEGVDLANAGAGRRGARPVCARGAGLPRGHRGAARGRRPHQRRHGFLKRSAPCCWATTTTLSGAAPRTPRPSRYGRRSGWPTASRQAA